MKSFLKWMSGTMVVMLLLTLPVSKVQAQDDYVSYQTFYDDLSPYGQWVYDPEYGNVWVPDAGNDFRPYYTNGHWAMTDYGNTWVSNYPWGWAPFHYGRWTYNPFYGWVWIPGNTWGPAWVSWRWGGGMAGWAPMGPGISINMSFGNYNCPTDWWVFVGPQYMYQPNFHNHWRGPRYNNTYINQTTIINNTYNNTYVYGPRARQIEQVTHQRVNTHRIANRGSRGPATVTNNTVNIYRPSVRGSAQEGRPRNVVQAPRSVGNMQGGIRNSRTEFKQMVSRGDVRPMNTAPGRGDRLNRNDNSIRQQQGVREQRFDSREDRVNQVRPATNDRGRMDQMQQRQNTQRQQMEQRQRTERPQMQQERIERQQPQRIEQRQNIQRQQMQQERIERQQPQRMEQRQPIQRMERPQRQPQRMEQRQQPQRIEQRQPVQRMERPQRQPQRMEQRQQPQRMEQRQSAPRPQPQMQRNDPGRSAPQGRPGGGERMGGRR